MANFDKELKNVEPGKPEGENPEDMHLDDARRVKVLSPGMLVFRRFIRNRLAVVGFVILFFMFTFSFLGPIFSPYDQAQVFTKLDSITKDYAGAIRNEELRYTAVSGVSFDNADRAQFLLALGKGEEDFSTSDGGTYRYVQEGEGFYRIAQLEPVAVEFLGGLNPYEAGGEIPEGVAEAYAAAQESGLTTFELGDVEYFVIQDKKENIIYGETSVALALLNTYDVFAESDADVVQSYDFKFASSMAIEQSEDAFEFNGQTYTIELNEASSTIYDGQGSPFAEVSTIIVNPVDQSIFLPVAFKSEARRAISNFESTFDYPDAETGEVIEYTIHRVNANYYIRKLTETEVINIYEFPSASHFLGTDNNGMDVITRLMFGGRVSLMVGFVVIFIEVFIGIIVGGVSGFFGGAVDTALMRFVDLFNSIPFYPIVLIFGSVMDTLEVDPLYRIFLLMLVLGLLGWTGVARVVRGQILSLREQDFMVATEATGIRVGRRIFRHLIPNVMPLLIVNATAGLGGIIITEATLGFLGLGVKYPLASWGSIINTASDAYVMTNYWFMWIPAGSLILLTVLGFNFVGDGLRDAYDPKMQR